MSTASDESNRPRVLIVEDEIVVAMDLKRSLVQLGYAVVATADSGDEAIRLAGESRPDVVLMDVQLRGTMDGIAAADKISKQWQIPIVYLTANTNDDETLSRARTAGAYGFLLKPYRPNDLNAALLVAVSQYRYVREMFSERTWLRTLFDSMSDAVIATDNDSRVRYVNPAAARLTGWNSAEAIGKPIEEVYELEIISGGATGICQVPADIAVASPIRKGRFLLRSRSGKTVPVENAAAPILAGGQPLGVVSIFGDITDRLRQERLQEEERDRLEEEVNRTTDALEATRAELRALSGHLMTAQEDERRRLARELHDDFGQRTAILEMQVVGALEQVHTDPYKVEELLLRMREQISRLEGGLREVAHRLHPSVIEDLGLIPALRSLAESFRDTGGDISMGLPDRPVPVTLEAATGLYRIAQEALRNVMKHAPGAPVRFTVKAAEKVVQMTVHDAGPGFNVVSVKAHGGLGLVSMQERARLAGGTLLLRTQPGEGTVITVRVPLQP